MSPVDISSKAPLELNLLPQQETLSSRHFAAMALASIAIHIVALVSFLSLPDVPLPTRAPVVTADLPQRPPFIWWLPKCSSRPKRLPT